MPRLMSFFHTQDQIRQRTKTVTRRRGKKWRELKPGDEFFACVKCQGLKKGEKVERLALLRCVGNTRERLIDVEKYGPEELAWEGFPDMTAAEFILFFAKEMNCGLKSEIQRIVFEYVRCACCDRAEEYNGYGSGPTIFTCPKNCGCHD